MYLKELTLLKREGRGTQELFEQSLQERIEQAVEANAVHDHLHVAYTPEDALCLRTTDELRRRVMAEIERSIFKGLR
ncbi:hypothetical protein KMB83_gp35 [Ralstonia phage Anchaing]|uniref:Uncharacterized protein n=1 Tax=Ralstonia phage Anchaing TaxID=2759719 RepID=A0A7G5B8D2_9CAUD|nr:hypothetical protein KMB83_gp35 [Ralstonia phage Anchaing]QMV32555.1 hypothetical protein A1_00035 [Ralstonia phage Anchaing]